MYRGFSALTIVLTISAISVVACTAAISSVWQLSNLLDQEYEYRAARAAAFSCTNMVLERLRIDPLRFTTAPTTIQVSDTATCMVYSVQVIDTLAKLELYIQNNTAAIGMVVTAERKTGDIKYTPTSWEENEDLLK